MRIEATAYELMEQGLWEKYCEETGTNIWAVNEGLLDDNKLLIWEIKNDRTTTS